MSTQDFLEGMNEIQIFLLQFLDDQDNTEENFKIFKSILEKQNIKNKQHELRLFLRLLLKISNNHHRTAHFFDKIDRILDLFKDNLSKYSNSELFSIFNGSKRLLLYLIEQGLLKADECFVRRIISRKFINMQYPQYFAPEIKPFINRSWFPKKAYYDAYFVQEGQEYDQFDDEYDQNGQYDQYYDQQRQIEPKILNKYISDIEKDLPENFETNRRIGENESLICRLVREDLVEDFITYVTQTNYPLDSPLNESIYETNGLFVKIQSSIECFNRKMVTLIEYATFYGSIQILQYLQKMKGTELDSSLLPFAVHSNNPEMIHLVEKKLVKFNLNESLKEAIKSHDNKVVDYILNNHIEMNDKNQKNLIINSIKNYNFSLLQTEFITKSYFYQFCRYDYFLFVEMFLKEDVNLIMKSIESKKRRYEAPKTAFFAAVERENIEIIKLFFLMNDKIDFSDNDAKFKKTALYSAVESENIEILKLLLNADSIDVNSLSVVNDYKSKEESYFTKILYKQTALFLAIEKQNIEIIKLLLEKKSIDVNILNEISEDILINEIHYDYYLVKRKTALYEAVERENIEIIKLLLENDKVNVNILNYFTDYDYFTKDFVRSYKTALHLAVEKNNIDIMQILLSNKNVDINIKDNEGKTTVDYASKSKIIQSLLEFE